MLQCLGFHNSPVSEVSLYSTVRPQHVVTIVHVNRIPYNDTFGEEPEVSNFYHNMKHIRIQTERHVLRHKPYTMPRRVVEIPMTAPSWGRTISTETELDCIPVALYYSNQMSKLSNVIKADGRFIPSAQYVDPEGESGEKYIVEVEPDNNLIIMGKNIIALYTFISLPLVYCSSNFLFLSYRYGACRWIRGVR